MLPKNNKTNLGCLNFFFKKKQMNILQLSIFVTFGRKISDVAESARSQEKDAKKKKKKKKKEQDSGKI